MEQEVFRDRLLELTLARLERAEKLLERAGRILKTERMPRFHDDLLDGLRRDVAEFLTEPASRSRRERNEEGK